MATPMPDELAHCDICDTWTFCNLHRKNWLCKDCQDIMPTMESLNAQFDELTQKAKELEELIEKNRIKDWQGFARSLLRK